MTDLPARSGPIAFIGLGLMGLPMAKQLVAKGFEVRGFDLSETARSALAAAGGDVAGTARDAARGAAVVITMLPNGRTVHDALIGSGDALAEAAADALVIEMSSSSPMDTRSLGETLSAKGFRLIDAPVSGGVAKAKAGSLAIIAGGDEADVAAARPMLEAMGGSIFHTGPLGTAHAMKALNNYVSAAGLAAACEALIVGEAFGLAPETIVDVLNASTGRNNSTENKLKPQVLTRSFGAGFGLALMAKDIGIAADMADGVGTPVPGIRAAAALWARAAEALEPGADHTAIFRFLETSAAQQA